MHKFELWAPNVGISSIDVVIGDVQHSMVRKERGIWDCVVESAGPGTAYTFRLNADPGLTYPDPRSRWQANGYTGASILVDTTFPWTDAGWQAPLLADAVFYELHIGTFTPGGTYLSAIEKLPYLKDLGITHIELMPIHEASGTRGWGYDGVYLYAPYSPYGTPDDLKALVDACHANGLAILLDVVYNHLGPEGNNTAKFAPYTKDEHTPWGEAINLDGPGSDHVREFIIDNALMWLEDYHFDGLRIDAMDELRDRSATHLIEEMTEAVTALGERLGRHLVTTAEFDQNDPRVVMPRDRGGLGLDAQWCDNFHHALMTVLSGDTSGYYADFGKIELLAKALRQAIVFDGQYSGYRNRRLGRPYTTARPDNFIVFNANHDQVGNRPLGDRPSHRLGIDKVKISAALTVLSRFVPMLFQGEEWAASTPFQYFTDHRNPAIAEATITGRRSQFGRDFEPDQIPNPQDIATFERSKLNWDELEQGEHKAMRQWYRDLIGLRHSIPGFGRDPANIEFDEEARWLVMTHSGLAVVCNLGDESQDIPFRHPDYHMIMASRGDCTVADGRVYIPGITVAVFAAQAVRNTMPEVAELPAASNPVVATLKSLWDRFGTGVKKKK
jgi:maltooligosyltrehalose trehalohydrolase